METCLMLAFNRDIVAELKARFERAPKADRPVSAYQQDILDWAVNDTGSAIVEAVAGSGKSTTLELLVDALGVRERTEVKTLNGCGHGALFRRLGRVQLDANKTRKLMRQIMSPADIKEVGAEVRQLVSLAKAYGVVPADIEGNFQPLMPDTPETWGWLMDHFEIRGSRRALTRLAQRILTASIEEERIIDFDDQKYLPAIYQMPVRQYDWVFVDEAQDVAPTDLKLIEMSLARGGRLVAVGDGRQAIYGFRGADSNALQNIAATFDAKRLPLSICYRCPQTVVAQAKSIVPEIESFDGAAEGTVLSWVNYTPEDFRAGDMVMCRNVAPLVSMTYRLVSCGVPARMLGRDIGVGLIRIIDKLKPKGLKGKDGLRAKLDQWLIAECAALREADKDELIEGVEDRHASISVLLQRADVTTVPKLKAAIEALFDGDADGVTCCTVHKSKGLEAERAFVLDPDRMPSKYARQDWQCVQERNLMYVAWTRAMRDLIFIRLEDLAIPQRDVLPEAA